MDDPVPTIDFSPSGTQETSYPLEREDVDGKPLHRRSICSLNASGSSGLLRVLDDLEDFSRSNNDAAALTAVRECRAAFDKLIGKMDSLESSFDRIAERSRRSSFNQP